MKRLYSAIAFAFLIYGLPVLTEAKHQGGGENGTDLEDGFGKHRKGKPQTSPGQNPQQAPAAQPRRMGHKPRQEAPQRHEPSPGKPGHFPLSQALQSHGVTQSPHRFSKRAQILNTERGHSTIPFPHQGMNGQALNHQGISPKNFNDPIVRNHMNFLGRPGSGFSGPQVNIQLRNETSPGHYYWHRNDGFDYVHYNDAWGFSWFGWYMGNSYFWTRYYGDRWWFYDDGFGRWSYWSGGSWYWQDPDNMSSIYLYSDGAYVSIN